MIGDTASRLPPRRRGSRRASLAAAVTGHRPQHLSSGRRRALRRAVEVERHGRDVGVRQSGQVCSRIASAVRSCRTRCQTPRYFRSGSSTLTSVSPSASSRATHSHGGAGEPAVGAVDELERHPRAGRGARHSSASSGGLGSSIAKCTARSSSGVSVRAYWIARAAARSRRSTNTSTTWRRRIGAVAAAGTSCSSSRGLPLVLPVEPEEEHDHHRERG